LLTDIENDVSTINKTFTKSADTTKNLSEVIISTVDKIFSMSGFVNEIKYTGSEIELIALNARLKAAHTGSMGKALGVLAEAIQKLSVDSGAQTAKISDSLSNIASFAKKIASDLDAEVSERNGYMDDIIKELNVLLGMLQKTNEEIIEILNKVDSVSHKLANDIKKSVESIKVHEQVASVIDEVVDGLTELIEKTTILGVEIDEDCVYEDLKEIESRYTMDSERLIHKSNKVPDLFIEAAEKVALVGADGGSEDDGLGDNIELF